MFGQRDQVVGAHEQVELGGQDAPAVLVEQREVQHDEDVVVVLVELRALVAREDVLVVERVEIEVLFQPVAIGRPRRFDVDPADARRLDDLRIRDGLGHDPIRRPSGRRRGRGSGRGRARFGTAPWYGTRGRDDRTCPSSRFADAVRRLDPEADLAAARIAALGRAARRDIRRSARRWPSSIWAAIVVSSPSRSGRLWGTGQDAYCYWFPTLADPYARSDWTDPIAYVYSPAFLQLLAADPASCRGRRTWRSGRRSCSAAVFVLTGRRWFAVGVVLGLMELAGGNIHLLLAAAMVLGFRWPATWALVLLTKITPGIGLLWFVVRREWRQLAIALGATARRSWRSRSR